MAGRSRSARRRRTPPTTSATTAQHQRRPGGSQPGEGHGEGQQQGEGGQQQPWLRAEVARRAQGEQPATTPAYTSSASGCRRRTHDHVQPDQQARPRRSGASAREGRRERRELVGDEAGEGVPAVEAVAPARPGRRDSRAGPSPVRCRPTGRSRRRPGARAASPSAPCAIAGARVCAGRTPARRTNEAIAATHTAATTAAPTGRVSPASDGQQARASPSGRSAPRTATRRRAP